MMNHQLRQGDIFLESVDQMKGQCVRTQTGGRLVLASGELTDHVHEVVTEHTPPPLPVVKLFQEPDGPLYLLIDCPCKVRHPEHGDLALFPGTYRITQQREYTLDTIRPISD